MDIDRAMKNPAGVFGTPEALSESRELTTEQKRALIKDFTDAVVKNYKVDASAVTITIVESAKEDKAKGGVLFSDMAAAKT